MRELFFKLFQRFPLGTDIEVVPFKLAHIIYLVLFAGAIVGGYFLLRNKTTEQKARVMRILVYYIVISYLSDFFVHEFGDADFVEGIGWVGAGLNIDKLPFHICTVLCPLAAFVEFNGFFKRFKEPVVVLSCLAPLMYLAYPSGIASGEPWCYTVVQAMLYHGVLLAWGILSVSLGLVKIDIKRCWHTGVLLVGITLWAKLGSVLLEHNWFFLNEDALYIGLVENGVIPKWSLMIINPIVFFVASLAVYGIYHLVMKTKKHDDAKVEQEEKALQEA